jgi:hypothetical protein
VPGQYRLAKTVAFPECRTITTLACVNQFYSFLAFLACSDRFTLRSPPLPGRSGCLT